MLRNLIAASLLILLYAFSVDAMELDVTVAVSGRVNEVQLDGNIVFCADSYGLWIADISDPQQVTDRSHWGSPGLSVGITMNGDYGYLCEGEDGMQVLDITNLEQPVALGSVPGLNSAYSAIVVGTDYAYVAAGPQGLVVLDINNPGSPVLFSQYQTTGWARAIAVQGDEIVVAAESEGIVILDATNLSDPVLMGTINLIGNAEDVILYDSIVIALDRENGVSIWDITDPTEPPRLSEIQLGGWSTDMHLEGTNLFVSDWFEGIEIYDVDQPANPLFISQFAPNGFPESMSLQNDILVLAGGDEGIEIWDVSTLTEPEQIGFENPPGSSMDVIITADQLIFEAAGDAGLRVWNYNLSPPDPLYEVDTPGWANSIEFNQYWVYLSDGFGGVRIYNNETSPQEAYHITTADYAGKLSVNWNWDVYVSQGASGFLSFLHEELNDPVVYGTTPTAGFVYDMSAAGNVVITAEGAGGFEIFDVSDPSSPVFIAAFQPLGGAWSVLSDESTAYVGTGSNVEIYDVTTPATPVLTSTLEDVGWAQSIEFLNNDLMAISSGVDGIFMVDITETPPVVYDHYNTAGLARGVAGYEGWLVLADEMALSLFDLSTAVKDQSLELPVAYSLKGPYPNPFNPATNISFTLRHATRVELSIFDMLGRRVVSLKNGSMPPGEHHVTWTPENSIASGTYILSLNIDGRNDTKSLIYLK